MGKDKRKQSNWTVFLRGELIGLGVYLLGVAAIAWMTVKGIFPEKGGFPAVATMCLLSAMLAGLYVVRRTTFGRWEAAVVSAVLFAVMLFSGNLCVRQGTDWTGRGGALLLCALGGGILPAVLCGGKRRKGKRGRRKAL